MTLTTWCPLTPIEPNKGLNERITPELSLDLQKLVDVVASEIVGTFLAGERPWAIVSAMASYSPLHVMLMNIEKKRYVPAPELMSPDEGNEVMEVAGAILEFLSRKGAAEIVSLGWNWSPLSWGMGLEEQGGFQSMCTKAHFQAWATPPIPEEGKISAFNDSKMEWIEESELSKPLQRLLLSNEYGEALGSLVAQASRMAVTGESGLECIRGSLIDERNWSVDARGASITFKKPLLKLLKHEPELFSKILQPIAAGVAELLMRLTEVFTDMNCAELLRTLTKVEAGPLAKADLAKLRATPRLRSADEIRAGFAAHGLPESLIPILLPAIRARCLESESADPFMMWRKGFGYALVLSGSVGGSVCSLRIMPGVYLGPGGVVEAQGIALARVPVSAPASELLRRRRILSEMGRLVAA